MNRRMDERKDMGQMVACEKVGWMNGWTNLA